MNKLPAGGRRSLVARVSAKSAARGELYIYDQIGDSWWGGVSAQSIVDALAELKAAGVSALDIYINSPGGDVFDGIAIHSALRRFPGEKIVHVDGLAASIASVIMLAGDRIVLAPSAMVMVHNPWTLCAGEASDLRETADRLEKVAGSMLATYATYTKQSEDDLRAWMDAETWMDASEAVARGFAHAVLEAPERDVDAALNAAQAWPILAHFKNAGAFRSQARARATTEAAAVRGADKDNRMDKKLIAAALGLPDTATEAEVLAAIGKTSETQRELLALTGHSTAAEALAVVRGWKQGADQAATLSARVAELEASAVKRERDALIEKGLADGKLTPAMQAWAESQSVEALSAFLAVAPRVVPLGSAQTEPRPTGADAGGLRERWEDMKPAALHDLKFQNPELYDELYADYQRRTARA